MNTERMDILDVEEAASYLKTHPQSLRRLLRSGKVPGRKVGKSWRLSRSVLHDWISRDGQGTGEGR